MTTQAGLSATGTPSSPTSFNSRDGKWHVLESENSEPRISFALGESEQRSDQVAVFVKTLADFVLSNRDAFVKIKLSHEGKHDIESINR